LFVFTGVIAQRSAPVHAWGDDGHKIVARIADHYLTATARAQVAALLAGDTSPLTAHDLASEATWADKFRDSDRNTTKVHYNKTHEWHYVDIALDHPDLAAACFQHPALPPGTAASEGPDQDCVVDKIEEFRAELSDAATPVGERLMALQFLLHFVGDLHQPLHASDDHDQGGNGKKVKSVGHNQASLHHYWDTEFVRDLGSDAASVANGLIHGISPTQVKNWSKGASSAWALESHQVARAHVYKPLPAANGEGVYMLSSSYVTGAQRAVRRQLSRAGVRLAALLNAALR
jgi:hypothetical protein